jgi:hypothetical protein
MKFKKFSPLKKSILCFVIVILLIKILTFFPILNNGCFFELNSFISRFIQKISIGFSLNFGDIFYTILALAGLFFLFRLFRDLYLKKYAGCKKILSKFIYFLAVFYFIFHLVWGFNYYKKPIQDSYPVENVDGNELKILAELYLQKCIQIRNRLNEDENGVFKATLNEVQRDEEIKKSRVELLRKFPELKFNSIQKPNLKPSYYSTMFSYLGVLGYYNPFTAESNFNTKMPDTKMLFTQFHETAHLFGFAPENEANFVGFLIGAESENLEFQYVADYKALRSILNKIVWENPAYVENFLERYSEPMKRDRAYEIEIQQKYQGTSDDAFSMLNEAYLRLNNQDGLDSYGKFVELLVGFHRKY